MKTVPFPLLSTSLPIRLVTLNLPPAQVDQNQTVPGAEWEFRALQGLPSAEPPVLDLMGHRTEAGDRQTA